MLYIDKMILNNCGKYVSLIYILRGALISIELFFSKIQALNINKNLYKMGKGRMRVHI